MSRKARRLDSYGDHNRLDRQRLLDALTSGDPAERARAIRSICPCRSGWGEFESDLELVRGYFKDPDPAVRKAALHVFEDAFEMKSSGLPTTPREFTNEMIATRRRSRFRKED